MFHTFQIPLTWRELLKRTLKETSADNALGLSAQLAYYFLLALVPAIVFVAAAASFFPGELIHDTLRALAGIVPPDVLQIIRDQLQNISQGEHGGVLTFGLVTALWSSSAAMVGITDALNRAYDIEEGRPWWKVRLLAMRLTVTLAAFMLVAFALVMIGPTLADHLSTRLGFSQAFATAWKIGQWPFVFAMAALGIGFIHYFAPDADQDWEWITPGAVLSTILWLVASLLFKVYVTNFTDYNETYGSLGGVIVLMLWFYVSGLSILVGAEMNAEIEHASPHGKAPAEKVAGERTQLGARAARAFQSKRQRRPAPPQGLRPSFVTYVVLGVGLLTSLARKTGPR